MIDASDLANPKEVGFIATSQDTLVGEGMQGLTLTTTKFSGDVLVMNHEQCGKNGKGGFSLWNITNPLKAVKLSEHAGDITASGAQNTPHDVNQYHSAFAWDAGDKAFLIASDDDETVDVDIFDITDPKEADQGERARPEPVRDPAARAWPPAVDPELLAQTGTSLTPEGNCHKDEFTLDNKFAITTDEDCAPFRLLWTTASSSSSGRRNRGITCATAEGRATGPPP